MKEQLIIKDIENYTMKLDTYRSLLDLQEAVFSQIDHEDAMVAIVYKVTRVNGEQLILKICDHANNYLREVYFLNLFAGVLPVPKILQVVPPTSELHGAILMECLPGDLLKIADFTRTLAYEIGQNLAYTHLNRLSGYGDPISSNLNPDPRFYFTLKFEEGLDECKEHLPLEIIENCQKYYTANVDLLMSVDGPCIAHRDFRPGNLIVYEGKLKGIIDWAGSRISFAEEDLFALEHGEWSSTNADYKKAFLEGYASVRKVPNYNRLVSFLRLNKAIATIGFTLKRGTWDARDARIYQYNRQFLENLFKVDS